MDGGDLRAREIGALAISAHFNFLVRHHGQSMSPSHAALQAQSFPMMRLDDEPWTPQLKRHCWLKMNDWLHASSTWRMLYANAMESRVAGPFPTKTTGQAQQRTLMSLVEGWFCLETLRVRAQRPV